MKKLHPFLLQFPEYYLALLFLLSGYSPPFDFHPIGMGLSCLMMLQALRGSRLSGLMVAALFLGVNVLLLAPLIAEASELSATEGALWQLLLGGLLLWSINLLAGGLMLYKYLRPENRAHHSTGT